MSSPESTRLSGTEMRVMAAVLVGMVRSLHASGIAHRDLKLSQVLLAADRTLRLADLAGAQLLPQAEAAAAACEVHALEPLRRLAAGSIYTLPGPPTMMAVNAISWRLGCELRMPCTTDPEGHDVYCLAQMIVQACAGELSAYASKVNWAGRRAAAEDATRALQGAGLLTASIEKELSRLWPALIAQGAEQEDIYGHLSSAMPHELRDLLSRMMCHSGRCGMQDVVDHPFFDGARGVIDSWHCTPIPAFEDDDS